MSHAVLTTFSYAPSQNFTIRPVILYTRPKSNHIYCILAIDISWSV